jgi:hypothetical protein
LITHSVPSDAKPIHMQASCLITYLLQPELVITKT